MFLLRCVKSQLVEKKTPKNRTKLLWGLFFFPLKKRLMYNDNSLLLDRTCKMYIFSVQKSSQQYLQSSKVSRRKKTMAEWQMCFSVSQVCEVQVSTPIDSMVGLLVPLKGGIGSI